MIGITIFIVALLCLLFGYPVAFTFAAIGIFFVIAFADPSQLAQIPFRIYANMGDNGQGLVLMAVPLFIFMGLILQRTKLAEQLLESMGLLFGSIRGGLAVSTILVGALLAASTGVVGASVVAMGLISLPVMLRHGYRTELAAGTISAAGTLGQIIPPSIVLIILADVLNVPVGDLFKASLVPGLVLIAAYVVYVILYSFIKPDAAPAIPRGNEDGNTNQIIIKALLAVVPPLALILVVLGSIFNAIATPTESSALGCLGAILLAMIYRKFSFAMLWDSAQETVKITAMVFAVLLGASLLGFFLDYIEISYIVLPLVYAVVIELGINEVWFAILVAMNLQTSFLTPPFGFALFYLKGVAPDSVQTTQIYRGAIPFIAIQLAVLFSLLFFPEWFGLSAEAKRLW